MLGLLTVLLNFSQEITFEERLLATLPEDARLEHDVMPGDFVFSRDWRTVAYIISTEVEGKAPTEVLYVNDQPVPGYERGTNPHFNDDGNLVALSRHVSNDAYFVANGKKGPTFFTIDTYVIGRHHTGFACIGSMLKPGMSKFQKNLVFGEKVIEDWDSGDEAILIHPDRNELTYVARSKDRLQVVSGDHRGELFDRIESLTASTDGSTLAYIGDQGSQRFVVINGRKNLAGETTRNQPMMIYQLVLSDNGKSHAYATRRIDGQETVVWNGEALDIPAHADDLRLQMHPANGMITYTALGRVYLGKSVEPKVGNPSWERIFSPDGKSIAYKAEVDSKATWVFKGVAGAGVNGVVHDPVFSSDGAKIAYAAYWLDIEKSPAEAMAAVVVGGKIGPTYEDVSDPVFSPDGSSIAYAARIRKGPAVIVVNGKPGDQYDAVKNYVFGPKGNVLAYVACKGRLECVVVGDKEGDLGYGASVPKFSPDGKTVAYRIGYKDGYYVIVGEKEHGPFTRIWDLFFSPDSKKVAFAALEGREVRWKVVPVE